jgi:acetolactate synthase-1/3 small subunit
MKHKIIAITENEPGVLYRIADLFLRRKINIERLQVAETKTKGVSRFTIVIDAAPDSVEKLVKQLNRIIEVIDVHATQNGSS